MCTENVIIPAAPINPSVLDLTETEKAFINKSCFKNVGDIIIPAAPINPSVLDLTETEKAFINRTIFRPITEIGLETIEVTITEEPVAEEQVFEVAPVIQTHVYQVWKDLLDNLRANNGIAEIDGRITHVAIVGIIGDDLVIIPTKAIKVKDKLNWKAELKALKLDDKIVLESDKFIAKLDVITDALDIEEMIRKYNDSVEADKQFTGFITV